MSKGTNNWSGSGNVCSNVVYNKTRAGEQACGFRIVIKEPHMPPLYLRVNLYGANVEICKSFALTRGDFIVVAGGLMSRMGRDDELIEVRGKKIVIKKEKADE